MGRHCDSCGAEILSGAIENGSALKYEDSYYCDECKADVLPLIDPKAKSRAQAKPENLVKAVRTATQSPPSDAGKPRPARAAADGDASATARPPKARPAGAARPPRASAGADANATGGARPPKRPSADAADARAKPSTTAPSQGRPPLSKSPKAKTPRGGEPARPAKGDAERPRTGKTDGARRAAGDERGARPGSGSAERGGSRGARSSAGADRARRRRDPSADGSSDGDDDRGVPKRRFPLPALLGGGAAVLALLITIIVMASSKDPATSEGPSADAVAVVVDREALKRQSQAAFAELKERIGAEPANYAEAIEQWEALVGSLEPVEAASAREEVTNLRDRHAKAATKAFEELQAKAEKLEQERRFQEALALLRAWPADSRSPAIDRQMRDLKRRLDLGAAAEREARPLLHKAKELAEAGSYRRAAGVLEGFDVDHYRETPWAQAIRDQLASYEVAESQKEQQRSLERIAERERQRIAAEKAALEKKIRDGDAWLARASYDPWFGDDLFTFKFPEPNPPNAWSMSKDRVLTGKSGAALQPGVGALTGTGESDWKDYVFEVEYKVVRGGFKLGVRYSRNRGAFVMLEPEVRKGGDWQKITISVRGRGPEAFQELVSGGSKRTLKFDAHDSSEGPICFVLEPQSEVQFRNLGVKVLPKELILD